MSAGPDAPTQELGLLEPPGAPPPGADGRPERRPVPWGWLAAGTVGLLLAVNGVMAAGFGPLHTRSTSQKQSIQPDGGAPTSVPAVPSPSPTASPAAVAAPTTTTREPILQTSTKRRSTPTASRSTRPAPPAASCAVRYQLVNSFHGPMAQITLTNSGRVTVSWSLTFQLGQHQRIASSWGAQLQQSDSTVTATGGWSGAQLAPGASTTFGYELWRSTTDTAPSGFRMNGSACTLS